MHLRPTLGVLLLGLAAACSQATSTAGPSTAAESPGIPTPPPSTTGPSGSILPSAAVGFAFDAESIAGYYETLGYACTEPQPSTQAAGYAFRSCQLIDPDGRTRVVGLVSDPAGDLADAFASVQARSGETLLDPTVTLEPLAAFLGATLGPTQGESLLPWLASHLGDLYTTTTIADLTVATYTATPDDHSKLTVEIGNPAYVAAPRPSASP